MSSDPLASVIALLRPHTVLSKVIRGAGAWSVRYEAQRDPGFCLMLEGTCLLGVDGCEPIALEAGDFVLLPAVPGFTMASDLRVPPSAGVVSDRDVWHGSATGLPDMRQLGGYFRVDRANAQLVVGLLPSVVHVRRGAPGGLRLQRVVELIADETADERPGRELVLQRLVDVLLIEALRVGPAPEVRERGLLSGLSDPGLARALQRIHADAAHPWTVAELGRVAGMSRATFAERFAGRVGMAPMAYVTAWRMALAKDALEREAVGLAEIAERVGFRSASAFSTAFSRHVGCSPRAFRRSVRAVGATGFEHARS
ncbi:MAG: AraC family transcriptional regulator [Myxococcota bacterium]